MDIATFFGFIIGRTGIVAAVIFTADANETLRICSGQLQSGVDETRTRNFRRDRPVL